MFADANTRYPWPESGHWSITTSDPDPRRTGDSTRLTDWKSEHADPEHLLSLHRQTTHPRIVEYLERHPPDTGLMSWSILDFAKLVKPEAIQLVHYSGWEDARYRTAKGYEDAELEVDILQDGDLASWARRQSTAFGVNADVGVPRPGDLFRLPTAQP